MLFSHAYIGDSFFSFGCGVRNAQVTKQTIDSQTPDHVVHSNQQAHTRDAGVRASSRHELRQLQREADSYETLQE